MIRRLALLALLATVAPLFVAACASDDEACPAFVEVDDYEAGRADDCERSAPDDDVDDDEHRVASCRAVLSAVVDASGWRGQKDDDDPCTMDGPPGVDPARLVPPGYEPSHLMAEMVEDWDMDGFHVVGVYEGPDPLDDRYVCTSHVYDVEDGTDVSVFCDGLMSLEALGLEDDGSEGTAPR